MKRRDVMINVMINQSNSTYRQLEGDGDALIKLSRHYISSINPSGVHYTNCFWNEINLGSGLYDT